LLLLLLLLLLLRLLRPLLLLLLLLLLWPQMRFPELYVQYEGDVDRVASRVAYEYLEGTNWVLRYYACGPATVDWRQQQQQQQGGGGGDTPGASWSWCYSYHYAPLMQVREMWFSSIVQFSITAVSSNAKLQYTVALDACKPPSCDVRLRSGLLLLVCNKQH
jgi:hypothetical protein